MKRLRKLIVFGWLLLAIQTFFLIDEIVRRANPVYIATVIICTIVTALALAANYQMWRGGRQ